jgi:hypothetical protein
MKEFPEFLSSHRGSESFTAGARIRADGSLHRASAKQRRSCCIAQFATPSQETCGRQI